MDIENSSLVRNIIIVGSTGYGKSSTGNFLFGEAKDKPFEVGNTALSCTFLAEKHINLSKKIRLIDTPGFGDNRFREKQIDHIIRDLTLTLIDPRVENTGVIDAFLMPVKLNPRPATLKSDLEHFMDLFGTAALKTLIILPIYIDDKQRTEAEAWTEFTKMTEIMNILGEAQERPVNANWICLWDNLNPKPNQEENLFAKMKSLESYTHQKFLEAAEETKKRLDSRVQEEVDRLISRAKNDFANDKEKLEQKVKEIEAKAEKEKTELRAAQDRARADTAKFIQAIQQMGADNKAELAKLYQLMNEERNENNRRMRELAADMNENNRKQIQEILSVNSQQMASMQAQIVKLSESRNDGDGGGFSLCNIF